MESNKENNQFNRYPSIHLNPKEIGFFNGDEYLCYVYKKTEKLISALYMVSNLFAESEPLKWSFRDKGLTMLSLNVSLANVGMSDREIVINRILSSVLEILSMLEVAFFAGLLSPMNHTILAGEFNSLFTLIEQRERHEKERNGYVLSEKFFNIQEKPGTPLSSLRNTYESNTTESKEYGGIGKDQHFGNSPTKGQEKTSLTEEKEKAGRSHTTSSSSASVKDMALRKDSRKAIIINLLKKQDHLTIKDFTKVIDNCSEKTIQRELLQLVSEGVLKKEGERRWSRYSLV